MMHCRRFRAGHCLVRRTLSARSLRLPARRCNAGFSLIELAIVLAALALVSWSVSSAYDNTGPLRDRAIAAQTGEALREQVRAFALRNARLPCPDIAGLGAEDADANGVCTNANASGWFPYQAVGLDLPAPKMRASYAVHRAPAADADLAVRTERTGDAPSSPSYRDVRDLIVGLRNAAGQPSAAGDVRVTGDAQASGDIDCQNNIRSMPAFFLVLPLSDRDGDGNRFDSVHSVPAPVLPLCAYAPGTPLTATYDDVVIAESTASLAGWLGARIP